MDNFDEYQKHNIKQIQEIDREENKILHIRDSDCSLENTKCDCVSRIGNIKE